MIYFLIISFVIERVWLNWKGLSFQKDFNLTSTFDQKVFGLLHCRVIIFEHQREDFKLLYPLEI